MNIRYEELCPSCKEGGVDSHIQFDTDTALFTCTLPKGAHSFTSLEEAQQLNALFSPERPISEAQPAEPVVPPTPAQEKPVAAAPKAAALLVESHQALEPPPIAAEVPTPPPPPKTPHTPAPSPRPAVQPKKAPVPPSVARALEKIKPAEPVIQVGLKKLPDGSALITLRIPEEYVGAVEQEAINQNVSVQEHMQNVFTWGLESNWFC